MTIFVFRSYLLTFSYGKQSLEVGLFLQKDLFFGQVARMPPKPQRCYFHFPAAIATEA